ncbi:MAG TPA: flagellar biosynthesis protein [Burkholderiaceae bacterium]|nr:flagellar biosynthesis protein [Burkholderiaceae bacterium]
MNARPFADRRPPADQAQGLRRLFARPRLRIVPVLANPHMLSSGVILERLCAALEGQGALTLVVDAADSAPAADELATMGLADCIRPLTPAMSYLPARGLPLRYVDAQGSTASFLQAVVDAAPRAEVVLVHAGASDLARMFARQALVADVVPLLLADDRPASVTHAYAGMKWLALRAQLRVHHLVLEISAGSPRAAHIAAQIARCADTFVGALLRDWSHVDPAGHAQERPPESLRRLARALLVGQRPDAAEPRGDTLPAFASRPSVASAIQALN